MIFYFKILIELDFMSSRPRKTFPPGTFIPTPQRMMAICQLCIAFSLMAWYLFQPFMGEYFTIRSRMLLYEYVMGTSDILKKGGQEEKLKRLSDRFNELPEAQKIFVLNDYHLLQDYAQRPAHQKVMDGVRSFILDIPPFEQAWIFFSITIAILILLKTEGARSAAWLLPLIVLAYALDNQWTGTTASPPDLQLFPTEKKLIQEYIQEPLSQSLFSQQKQLQKGWQMYLIDRWSSNQEANEEQKIEEGEYQFTLARLQLLHNQPYSQWLNTFHEKQSYLLLFLFFTWNTLFAYIVSRPNKVEIIDPTNISKGINLK